MLHPFPIELVVVFFVVIDGVSLACNYQDDDDKTTAIIALGYLGRIFCNLLLAALK